MTEEIERAVHATLNKYDKDWGDTGVDENLAMWEQNKADLAGLLRKHPNWNERDMAVIFSYAEKREIEPNSVNNLCVSMAHLANPGDCAAVELALRIAVRDLEQYIKNPDTIALLKEAHGINCGLGQKASRVIRAIAVKWGFDKHPAFEQVYAQLADSISPLDIERNTALSVHPCAYLEMSNKNSSWSSCHTLKGGCYQAGTLSYMNDRVSMIFTVSDPDSDLNLYAAPKLNRQVFAYDRGLLLQSRLYPNCDNVEKRRTFRNIVQKIIADSLEVPNIWRLVKSMGTLKELVVSGKRSLHYADYFYPEYKPNVSMLNGVYNENSRYEQMVVGTTAYCMYCGETLDDANNIFCDGCSGDNGGRYTCDDCGGDYDDRDDLYEIGDGLYCSDCSFYCEHCEERCRGQEYRVHDNNGNEFWVCEDCHSEHYRECDHCERDFEADEMTYLGNGVCICENCEENYYSECENCEEIVSNDDLEWHEGYPYCESCYETIMEEKADEDETADDDEAAVEVA